MKIEEKTAFNVSGYTVKTDEASQEKDVALFDNIGYNCEQ